MENDPTFAQYFSHPTVWFLLAVYFAPTIMAVCNKSTAWYGCFLVNLFFGWTLIGWIAAIVLAFMPSKERLSHRERAKRAMDNFYLREEEKSRAASKGPARRG